MIGTYAHQGAQQRSIGCMDYEELAVTNGAIVGLTAAKIRLATYGFVRISGGNVRSTIHPGGVPQTGVAPAGVGFVLFDGDNFVLNKVELNNFAAIAEGATNGRLHVAYYGMNAPSEAI